MSGPHRLNPALVMALMGAAAGVGSFGPSVAEMVRGPEMTRFGAQLVLEPGTTVRVAPQSNAAKLRDLNFMRARPHRHTYRGVGMTVAQGKRVARKVRNRQRHKKQWKAAVR